MRSQEEICIGSKHTLFSTVLGEQRRYWVHLPESYDQDTNQIYPVIYLLDGDSYFHSLVGISKAVASGRTNSMPPSIIIGILNTDRTHDLTPTASAAGRDGQITSGAELKGGGADEFTIFLSTELLPIIEKSYRTNGVKMLIGHSYGGLFTLNTFLRNTELFDIYLALDPSLWWDQGKLVQEAGKLIKEKDFLGKKLYVGVATKKRTDRIDIHHDKVNYLLEEIVPQAKNLSYFSKSFPDENHGTVVIPGIYDGIKQLFEK